MPETVNGERIYGHRFTLPDLIHTFSKADFTDNPDGLPMYYVFIDVLEHLQELTDLPSE